MRSIVPVKSSCMSFISSPQAEPPCNHAPEDLAGPTADREPGRMQHGPAEYLGVVLAIRVANLGGNEQPEYLRNLALEGGAHVLEQGSLDHRLLAAMEHARDRGRHPPQAGQVGDEPPDVV